MIHFSTINNNAIRNVVLVSILLFLQLYFIDLVHGQTNAQSGYNLIGTIRSGDFSGAVINIAKGEQSFFRLFEKLPDGSQIVQVRNDSISIKGTDGILYDMFISHEKTLGSAAHPQASNDSSVNASLSTLATTLTTTGPNKTALRMRHRGQQSPSEAGK
jgi:hypothetical protein